MTAHMIRSHLCGPCKSTVESDGDTLTCECWVENNGQTCTCECHDQSEHWDGIPPLGGDDMDGR